MLDFFGEHRTTLLVLEIIYTTIIVLVFSPKIIMDTKNVSKTLAYLLLIIFLPFIGIFIYFMFGVNYRKNKFYTFKIERNEALFKQIQKNITTLHERVIDTLSPDVLAFQNTINFLFKGSYSPVTQGNHVELLLNGEEKFPKLMEIINQAKHHIHLEYYIYENDQIGNRLADLLIKKAEEGVIVRFLYDDFGSSKISKPLLKRLREGRVQVSPVNKIRFKLFANRMNYRDHRKIVVVDGEHVFTGGINVADTYINTLNKRYWRDTHLYFHGNGAYYFQFLFMTNWVFATQKPIPDLSNYFKAITQNYGNKIVQGVASGPDTNPSIMLATTASIYEAKERIYITTPYFIPVESVLNAIKSQALAGIDVRLLVPKKGDSVIVNAAAFSYYTELLRNGVRIFLYEKGFVHAKTMLIDHSFSCVGTANMDVRSQELNFEVNTHIYNQETNQQLYDIFMNDLKNSTEITYQQWKKRPKLKVFSEHLARLFSPLL